jgi:type I site-specific restriction-modification system R (restriction) subunit
MHSLPDAGGYLCLRRVLSGARAVQVLGRINRPAPSKPGCLLVVDFVNSAGAIREAFGEYYGTTTYCTGGTT